MSFIRRLKKAVEVLEDFPEFGAAMEEFNDPGIREIPCGAYRIIYRVDGRRARILAVVHGARLLRPDFLERD